MKQSYELVVVIPLGPNCEMKYIIDTIDSLRFYLRSSYKIILADDSHKGTGQRIKREWHGVDVIETPEPMGKLCGLYITLGLAFNHALSKYEFEALLRMDTDVLVIGAAPEKEAIEMFSKNPRVGIAGQYPNEFDGRAWDVGWPATQLHAFTHTRRFFEQREPHQILLWHYIRARLQNYRRGESVFGGACFYNPAFLLKLQKKGLLPHYTLRTLILEEDHLFSLLALSLGFKLGDLSSGRKAMGCTWKGLPAAPWELEQSGKKIIHSTRYWNHMNEDQIRSWFREKRKMPNNDAIQLLHQ